jgi:cob(I)alamin adenosyltransferase
LTEKKETIKLPRIKEEDILMLEKEIDKMDTSLPNLNNFILPSGHSIVSKCHIGRTVCRRAERNLVSLSEKENVDALHLKYLNRLSDYLFVLARFILYEKNISAVEWEKE